MNTISQVFQHIHSELAILYHPREAESIAHILFREFLGYTRTEIILRKDEKINAPVQKKLNSTLEQLLKGIPIQQIIGYLSFAGIKVKVNKDVLIPRPETEELVYWVAEEAKMYKNPFVLDIGTGSGCIAIALSKMIEDANIVGVDISQQALETAQINLIANNAVVDLVNLDITKPDTWKKLSEYDIIVSNPPYVPESEKSLMHENVLNHEPHIALFVKDENPIIFYEFIADFGLKKLSVNGLLFFEVHHLYADDVVEMLEKRNYKNVQLRKDIHNKKRFVRASIR